MPYEKVDAPVTGDPANVTAWLIMAVMSASGMIGGMEFKKRKEN